MGRETHVASLRCVQHTPGHQALANELHLLAWLQRWALVTCVQARGKEVQMFSSSEGVLELCFVWYHTWHLFGIGNVAAGISGTHKPIHYD